MTVTKLLGFRYLWIDRYCIPQDNHEAKASQIRLMGKIYSSSVLTIIAAAGDGPEYGLPGISRPMVPGLGTADTTSTIGETSSVSCIEPVPFHNPLQLGLKTAREINTSTWNTRGWTYQEAALATRRLVFTPSSIYFQGPSDSWVFGQGPAKSVFTGAPRLKSQEVDDSMLAWFNTYIRGCTNFTRHASIFVRRDLTYDNDTYAAFRNIQSFLQSAVDGTDYWFCGLQIGHPDSLATALTWTFEGDFSHLSPRAGVPSWTWLGWKLERGMRVTGPWCPRLKESQDGHVKIHNEMTSVKFSSRIANGLVAWQDMRGGNPDPASEDIPLLRISGWTFPFSYITVGGVSLAVNLEWSSSTSVWSYGRGTLEDYYQVKADYLRRKMNDLCFRLGSTTESLLCLIVGRIDLTWGEDTLFFVILSPCGAEGSYRRIHAACLRLPSGCWKGGEKFLGWSRKTVVIL